MTNNAPDYEDNLAFEPVKTAGTIEMVTKDGKAVAIRCYIDSQHYFDLALKDVPEQMTWYEVKLWCEEHYCRLPMKHEMKFIYDNLSTINKMIRNAGGKMLKNDWYWSSSEGGNEWAWTSTLNLSYGLLSNAKYSNQYVRPVLAL